MSQTDTASSPVTGVIPYSTEHKPHFKAIGTEWISKAFTIEPIDIEVMDNPERAIIEPGGAILFGTVNGEVAGTVALKKIGEGSYELTKFAVYEKYRGHNLGMVMLEAAIAKAKEMGGHEIILFSRHDLAAAVAQFKKAGFTEIPMEPGVYARANIKMRLPL